MSSPDSFLDRYQACCHRPAYTDLDASRCNTRQYESRICSRRNGYCASRNTGMSPSDCRSELWIPCVGLCQRLYDKNAERTHVFECSVTKSVAAKLLCIEKSMFQILLPQRKESSVLQGTELFVRPTRYAHCGESPRGAAMMRNPRPEEQLRGGNKPWERKFEGKSRLYEQELHIRPDGRTRLQKVPKSHTSSRVHKVDADGAGGKQHNHIR